MKNCCVIFFVFISLSSSAQSFDTINTRMDYRLLNNIDSLQIIISVFHGVKWDLEVTTFSLDSKGNWEGNYYFLDTKSRYFTNRESSNHYYTKFNSYKLRPIVNWEKQTYKLFQLGVDSLCLNGNNQRKVLDGDSYSITIRTKEFSKTVVYRGWLPPRKRTDCDRQILRIVKFTKTDFYRKLESAFIMRD